MRPVSVQALGGAPIGRLGLLFPTLHLSLLWGSLAFLMLWRSGEGLIAQVLILDPSLPAFIRKVIP